jgi:DNA-binding Lrp family transcriptional regulator
MTTRRTSAQAYHQIEAEGLLSKLKLAVYQELFHHGPLTAKEVAKRLGAERDSISPRMKELVRLGVVAEAGERFCTVSEREAVAWDVTDALPQASEMAENSVKPARGKANSQHATEIADLKAALAPFAALYSPDAPPLRSVFLNNADLERAARVAQGA